MYLGAGAYFKAMKNAHKQSPKKPIPKQINIHFKVVFTLLSSLRVHGCHSLRFLMFAARAEALRGGARQFHSNPASLIPVTVSSV
jgi:hypothetical protein